MVTSAIPPSNRGATGDRYVLSAFHARGGMGEVWRCHDGTIGREVALKRLLSDRSAARERFLCEAQITGQLEHPAIVPIHDLGYDDNGRPFYVMKFVHGRTLKSAVDEFHAPVDAAPVRLFRGGVILRVRLADPEQRTPSGGGRPGRR